MSDTPALLLDAAEARMLGCLVEKEATTPEPYPLTENAAQQAANPKTSREPVMALASGEVAHALERLAARRFAIALPGAMALDTGPTERSVAALDARLEGGGRAAT